MLGKYLRYVKSNTILDKKNCWEIKMFQVISKNSRFEGGNQYDTDFFPKIIMFYMNCIRIKSHVKNDVLNQMT